MKTKESPVTAAVFYQLTSAAVSELEKKLQRKYERMYPGLGEIIRLVVNEEAANARELSVFPHLLLPDLVEMHIGKLGLQPIWSGHDSVWASSIELPHALAAAC